VIYFCPIEHRVGDGCFLPVMAGLGPTIHVLTGGAKDVDGRHTGGHDEVRQPASVASSVPPVLPDHAGGMTEAH